MTGGSENLFVKGQRIDRYEIREHIGQGGMGAVYRAVDTKLGRTVALKTVVAHRRGDRLTEEIRERFMREALAASRVDHRNVVQVLDFGFTEDGTPYMVMEYLRGRSLERAPEGDQGTAGPGLRRRRHAERVRGAARVPPRRDHSSRPQAGEHLPVRHRHRLGGEGAGFRHLEGLGRGRADSGRTDHRDAPVPVTRTDRGDGRTRERPVRDRRPDVRLFHAAVALRGLPERQPVAGDFGRDVRCAAHAAARTAGRARGDRDARDECLARRQVRIDSRARAAVVGVRQPARSGPVEDVLFPHAGRQPGCREDRHVH